MLASLVIISLLGADPGPIDAFRANYAASKAEMDYHYRCGLTRGSAVASGRLWATPDLALEEKPEFEILGRWSCDGGAESYSYEAPPETALEGRKHIAQSTGTGSINLRHTPSYEGIYDGEIEVGHYLDESIFRTKTLNASILSAPSATITRGCGPYSWWPSYPFPAMIRMDFPASVPQRGDYTRGSHRLQVEVYRRQYDGFAQQLEVSYDPAVGYLPRYARHLVEAGPTRIIREFYLIDAKPCAAGGFVPTEWYTTTVNLDQFVKGYPTYSYETVLEPQVNAFVGHFKASSFRDRSKPVELTRLTEVTHIDAPGGLVKLNNNPRSLTLGNVKSIVGRKLTESIEPALPTLDVTELNAYKQSPHSSWPFYVGAALLIAGLFVVMRWRARAAAFLLLIACSAGCGQVGPPIAKISASFQDCPKLYDARNPVVPLRLMVRNEGNVPLRITKGDGGCSCREVDRAAFPVDLAPGKTMAATVKMSHGRMSTPQALPFTFETDHGALNAVVPAHVLPQDQLSPESPSAFLVEGDSGWSIDLTHRSIFREDSPRMENRLVIPAEFEIAKSTSTEGKVASAPGFQFRDETFTLTLKDRGLGLRKTIIKLVEKEGTPVAESTAVWNRLPFLSASPERLTLGPAPIRVFLRCQDTSIELTKVVEVPAGVKAFVSSPRELTVALEQGAPGVIKGELVVATTASERPPLRIAVVRYTSE